MVDPLGLLAGLAILRALHAVDVAGGMALTRLLRRRLRQQARRRRAIALTYDDGPGHELQPRLLDLLQEQEAVATFYLLGIRSSVMSAATDALVDAGHELGDHGFAHLDATRTGSRAMAADARRSEVALADAGAPVPTWRPAYGRLTLTHWLRQRRRGRRPILWTHDAGDLRSSRPDPEAFADAVAADGGGVVMLH